MPPPAQAQAEARHLFDRLLAFRESHSAMPEFVVRNSVKLLLQLLSEDAPDHLAAAVGAIVKEKAQWYLQTPEGNAALEELAVNMTRK